MSQWDAERQMGFHKLCKQRGPHRSTGLKAQQSVWGTISHCAWPDNVRQVWEWVWNKDGQRRGPREGVWFPGSATSLKLSLVWRGKHGDCEISLSSNVCSEANSASPPELETVTFLAPESLQVVTAAMKLKDACSLEGKLWQTQTVY